MRLCEISLRLCGLKFRARVINWQNTTMYFSGPNQYQKSTAAEPINT